MVNPFKDDWQTIVPVLRKNVIIGTILLAIVLVFSHFRWFGIIGYWGWIIQLFAFTIAVGKINYTVTVLIIRRCSPALRYRFTLRPMRILLAVILITECVLILAFNLDVEVRTPFIWVFIPVYQILNGLRTIQIGVDNAERMEYVPEELP